jgi:hypothetical protein
MAKNETRRLNPAVLAEDLEILAALKDVADYQPANSSYAVTAVNAINNRRIAAHDAEVQTSAAAEAARDNHVAVQWELHNALLGAKDQITAQFGKDSNEVQSMKLKKKSEYKNPTRKNNKAGNEDPKP